MRDAKKLAASAASTTDAREGDFNLSTDEKVDCGTKI